MNLNIEKIKEIRDEEFEKLRKTEIIAGDEKGNMTIKDRRFNAMGGDYFMGDFLKLLEETVGPAAGGILYNSGIEIGKSYFKIYVKKEKNNKEEIIGRVFGLLKFCGYSNINFSEKGTIIVKNSPTAVAFNKKHKEKVKTCYYLAGIFAGLLSKIFEKEINVEEIKCQGKGDTYCEFEIKNDLK